MFSGFLAGVLLVPVLAPDEGAIRPPRSGAEAHNDAVASYGIGIWQARRGRLMSAAQAHEAAAKQDPEATASLQELVRIYSLIGREPEAIRAARTILERSPDDVDAAHTLARLLSDAGDLKGAITAAKLAAKHINPVERSDKAVGIYRDLATLLDRANDPAGAASALQQALDVLAETRKATLAAGNSTPKHVDEMTAATWERLGDMLIKQGETARAVVAFQSAHSLYSDPTRADDPNAAARLNWNLAEAYSAAKDYGAALRHLEAFLKLRPLAVEPYERLVAILTRSGRSSEVIPTLQKYAADGGQKNLSLRAVLAAAQARDPASRRAADLEFTHLSATTNDPKIVRVMIRSYIETDQARKVVAAVDQAYQLLKNPTSTGPQKAFAAETARVIADILRADPEAANAVLRAGADDLRAGTDRAHQTWYLIGVLAARHNKLDLAAVQFYQAARNAPREPPGAQAEAYDQLIAVLRRSRKHKEIVGVCRDALRENVSVIPVGFNFHLAHALAELGEVDEALAAADKAILQAGDANRLVTRLQKVAVLGIVGRRDEAVVLCRKLLDEFDTPADRARIRYSLASAYWGAKKYTEGEAELRAILDAGPDHSGACNDLGYHLAEQGRNLDEAERLVRHAIANDRDDRRRSGDPEPDNAAYLDSLGWVLFRKGQLGEARAVLEKVSEMPDGASDPVVWDHLGDVLFRSGEKGKAKTAWEKAAELYKTDSRGKQEGRQDEIKRKLKRVP